MTFYADVMRGPRQTRDAWAADPDFYTPEQRGFGWDTPDWSSFNPWLLRAYGIDPRAALGVGEGWLSSPWSGPVWPHVGDYDIESGDRAQQGLNQGRSYWRTYNWIPSAWLDAPSEYTPHLRGFTESMGGTERAAPGIFNPTMGVAGAQLDPVRTPMTGWDLLGGLGSLLRQPRSPFPEPR